MVIIIASEKGGTGKTTMCTNLAVMRAKKGSDVLLIDADPQKSSADFVDVRNEEGNLPDITCSSIIGRSIKSEVQKIQPKFDDIFIDVGGRDNTSLRSAIVVADVLVIPFLASQYDTWGLERMDDLIDESMAINSNLRAFSFLNKVDSNPKMDIASESVKLAKSLPNINFKDIHIGYRVAFRRSVAEGLSVTELTGSKKDEKAILEMDKLYREIFK